MIGLILRLMTGGMIDGSGVFVGMFACCAICGLYRCASCRCRDCRCIRRCLLCTGVDRFEEFDLTVYVHEASFTGPKAHCKVRVKAGEMQDLTSERANLNFQEPCSVLVEQGLEYIDIDLWDDREKRVLANLRLDVVKELLEAKQGSLVQKNFRMKQRSKNHLNARIKLSIFLDSGEELEKGILEDMDLGRETDMILRSQMQKMADENQDGKGLGDMSKLEIACRVTAGPLDLFGSWGTRKRVWMHVRMPSDGQKKYWLEIYQDERHVDQKAPEVQVDLLKVQSVQADPGRDDVFIINYVDQKKVQRRLTFARVDRPRNSWVDLLKNAITFIREDKDTRRKK
mmetsp:Transcript_46774/g.84459  ORF Transcript_46774/g.84459 Transcript_46774/m.84459 type:complete len:342 (+) Transcript_46774:120-1145(+)